MALPTVNTALDRFFDSLLYTGAYLSGTKGLVTLGKKVLDARSTVQKGVIARNEKNDQLVLANVAQDIAWEEVAAPLTSFERQVDAFFDADRAGYKKVFPLSVSVLSRSSEVLRPKVLAPVLAFARKPGHQGRLAQAAKELVTVWDAYAAASAAEAEARAALSKAVAALAAAKRQGVIVMREVEGNLRAKFAENPKQWKRFFRSGTAAKKKAAAQSEAPEQERVRAGA